MNELLPIIRRQRRPLLVVPDRPPLVVGNVEPVVELVVPVETIPIEREKTGRKSAPVERRPE